MHSELDVLGVCPKNVRSSAEKMPQGFTDEELEDRPRVIAETKVLRGLAKTFRHLSCTLVKRSDSKVKWSGCSAQRESYGLEESPHHRLINFQMQL
jgi:hypothetical protein